MSFDAVTWNVAVPKHCLKILAQLQVSWFVRKIPKKCCKTKRTSAKLKLNFHLEIMLLTKLLLRFTEEFQRINIVYNHHLLVQLTGVLSSLFKISVDHPEPFNCNPFHKCNPIKFAVMKLRSGIQCETTWLTVFSGAERFNFNLYEIVYFLRQ